MAVPRFQLHARLFRGSLAAPVRNELRTADGDDRVALEEMAAELGREGVRCGSTSDGPAPQGRRPPS